MPIMALRKNVILGSPRSGRLERRAAAVQRSFVLARLRRLRPLGPYAFRQLFRQRSGIATSLIGVAAAIVLIFMELGFKQGLMNSATRLHAALAGEVVLVSPYYQTLDRATWIPGRLLIEARADPQVVAADPLFVANLPVRDLASGTVRLIAAFAFDPARPVLDLPGLAQHLSMLGVPMRALFDSRSRPVYGPISALLDKRRVVRMTLALPGSALQPEIDLIGTIALGPSIASDGAVVVSDVTLSQLMGIPLDRPNFGVIRVAPGADPAEVARRLQRRLGPAVRVLTKPQFIAAEQDAWARLTPIGSVLRLGVLVGGAIGLAFIYQILQVNIRGNLSSYAVLKSMGYPGSFFVALVAEIAAIVGVASFLVSLPAVWLLYWGTAALTGLDMRLGPVTILYVLAVVLVISLGSALLAVRKLRAVDPVSLF
jgi:putative ABC transport system permease protein